MFAIYKREFMSYFRSPIGCVFMGMFLLISGLFFTTGNVFSNSASVGALMSNISFIFILIVPILTMRLISDDRRNKTDQLLITSPLSIPNIVIGKFLAACTVFLITLLITLIYVFIMSIFGTPALGQAFVSYLGFFLMGCCFIAVGTLMSALTENQITAAITTFGTILSFFLMDTLSADIKIKWLGTIMNWLSIYTRFSPFASGLLSIDNTVYLLTFMFIFLFLTVRVIEKRRWSE